MHFDSLKSQNFAILSVVIVVLITTLSDEVLSLLNGSRVILKGTIFSSIKLMGLFEPTLAKTGTL